MSIHAFRAALNNLVTSTAAGERSMAYERKAKKNPKARQNMAVRVPYQGRTIEFDTPAEAAAFLRDVGATEKGLAAPSAPAPRKASRPAKQAARPARPAPQVKTPGGAPTYAQAKAIGFSIGGLQTYCPDLVGQAVPGGVHAFALSRLGLTAGMASEVIEALQREGLLYTKTPEGQARAREILATVGGVVCPMPGRAAGNPKGRLPGMAAWDVYVNTQDGDAWDTIVMARSKSEAKRKALEGVGPVVNVRVTPHRGPVRSAAGNPMRWFQPSSGSAAGSQLGVARFNMAGRPGKHGLPRAMPGSAEMSKLSKTQLQALGTPEAQMELARRKASKAMRTPRRRSH